VQAIVSNSGRLGIDSEEAADLSWKSADCTLSIHLDYLTKPTRRSLTAYGDAGTLRCDLVSGVVSLDRPDLPTEMSVLPDSRSSLIAAQVRAFMNQSTNGCDPRLADGMQGLKALSICEAAQRASDSRREEPVLYP
jgi:predicted dehydrogenase